MPKHPDAAPVYPPLRREGQYEEAIKMYSKCLKTYRRSYGPDHEVVGDVLCVIGKLRENLGRDDEAIEVFGPSTLNPEPSALNPKH